MPVEERFLRTMPQLAADPASPPAGTMLLYFKTDGRLYRKDPAGTVTEVRTADVDVAALLAFGG